ncbi:unnamed protein product [Ambrosiozyma monospora]|uniref:Unnamed protein product n=1 Tax=Ambrosiozyma monospora TaxID=43982 RepID=A0ACB5T1E0_AMBMO|nr:unnamed protein product [Ambrosiozyma monospora]
MIIVNVINTLNQVTEATENKVFKQQLQNQLKVISESLVTHVKYQVENDPLKNPAPLVKRICDQFQEEQKQPPPQPESQLKRSEQSEQQPKQEPEISKSNFEKPAAPITLSVEQILALTAARQIKLQTSNIANLKHPKKCPNWQVTKERKGIELS